MHWVQRMKENVRFCRPKTDPHPPITIDGQVFENGLVQHAVCIGTEINRLERSV